MKLEREGKHASILMSWMKYLGIDQHQSQQSSSQDADLGRAIDEKPICTRNQLWEVWQKGAALSSPIQA